MPIDERNATGEIEPVNYRVLFVDRTEHWTFTLRLARDVSDVQESVRDNARGRQRLRVLDGHS